MQMEKWRAKDLCCDALWILQNRNHAGSQTHTRSWKNKGKWFPIHTWLNASKLIYILCIRNGKLWVLMMSWNRLHRSLLFTRVRESQRSPAQLKFNLRSGMILRLFHLCLGLSTVKCSYQCDVIGQKQGWWGKGYQRWGCSSLDPVPLLFLETGVWEGWKTASLWGGKNFQPSLLHLAPYSGSLICLLMACAQQTAHPIDLNSKALGKIPFFQTSQLSARCVILRVSQALLFQKLSEGKMETADSNQRQQATFLWTQSLLLVKVFLSSLFWTQMWQNSFWEEFTLPST